jgi:hypothetical protein
MSPEEFFKKGITQISAGKRIRRGGKSVYKRRGNPPGSKSKINEGCKSAKNEGVQNNGNGMRAEKECHVDVII